MPHFSSERLAGVRSPVGRCATADCLILQYRRVALLSHDPLGLAVQPCNFERQMEYLAANFHVITMDELKLHLQTATPFREHSVVVTFDGGYSDVLYTARDVLERFEIPATVFVPSLHLMEKTRFWWDVLEDALLASDSQDRLAIELDGKLHWWPLANQHDRFLAFEDLYEILSRRMPSEQREIVAELAGDVDGFQRECDNHAALSMRELRKLEGGGLITVGGYTHNCVMLSSLPEEEQAEEIGRNKEVLEELLGHRIEYFAYPFGDGDCLAGGAVRILKGLGFTLSCTISSDTVNVAEPPDPFALPRLAIGDWNPFTFYRRLMAFLD